MAEGHEDHPYATYEEQMSIAENISGNYDSDSASKSPLKCFQDSPRKVLVHENQSATVSLLNDLTHLGQLSALAFETDMEDNAVCSIGEHIGLREMEAEGDNYHDEVDGLAKNADNAMETNVDDDDDSMNSMNAFAKVHEELKSLEDGNLNFINNDSGTKSPRVNESFDGIETNDSLENGVTNSDNVKDSSRNDAVSEDKSSENSDNSIDSFTNLKAPESQNGNESSKSQNANNDIEDEIMEGNSENEGDDNKDEGAEEYAEMSDDATISNDSFDKTSVSITTGPTENIVLKIQKKRGRKRKKRSQLWSKASPYKGKRLSISPARANANLPLVVTEMTDASTHAVEEAAEAHIGEMTQSELNEEEAAEGRRRRSKSAHNSDYMPTDEVLDEILGSEAKVHRQQQKRKSFTVKPFTDADLERYLEPFKHGWRREIVMRGTVNELSPKTAADTYYFPPVGNKIRSMVQIADYLSSHETSLTVDNFTFMRRPIGAGDGEMVRNASSSGRGPKTGVSKLKLASPKPVVVLKRTQKSQTKVFRKFPNKEVQLVHDDNDGNYDTPEVVIERDSDDFVNHIIASGIASEERGKIDSPKKDQNGHVMKNEGSNIVIMHPSNEAVILSPSRKKTMKATARKSTTQKHFKKPIPYTGIENLCSMRCPGMEGIPPMLHCNVCMCLFHNECVNYFGQDSDFVCLRCKDVQDSLGNFNPTVTSSNDSMVMKVNAPMILSQLGATSGDSRPIKMVQANVPLSTTISGIPFHFSNPNVSGMGMLNSSLQSTPATSSPSVALALSMAGLTPVSSSSVCPIQPAASIKQEPFDNYDTDGVQASSDALKGLKAALLNKINSPDHPVMTVSGQDKMFKTISPRPTSFTSGNTNINPAYPLLSTMPRIPVVNTTRFMTYGAPRMPVVNSLYQPLQNPGPPLPGLVSMNSANKSQQPLQTVPSLLGPTSIVPVTTSHGLAVGETPSSGPVVVNAKHVAPMNGQLLTLPHAVVKRLNLNKALSLKINNKQIYVPPSAFFQSNGGLKVFLPLNTFPAADDQKMDLSVSNEKSMDDSLANGPSEKLESVKRARACDIRKSKYYSKFCMIKALYGGYDVMTVIFRYLQLKDLLRCSEVCRTWRLISMSPNLWRRVSFKGCRISDMQKALQYIGSRLAQRINLDGLGHVGDEANRTWHQLLVSLQHVPTLRHITFGVIPSTPLQSMCSRLVNVEGFCAEKIVESNDDWVSPTKLDISKFSCMTGLRELRLSGLGGLTLPSFSFSGGLADLGVLSKLTTLHLTSLREVEGSEFSFISLLSNLSDLALGDCTKWTQETYSHLQKLSSLRRLRLEHGGSIPDTGLGLALSNLMLLEELELYCFTVAYTFGNHISDLISLRRFYILPDNSTFASEVNSNTLAAIEKLPNLKELTWAIPEKSSASIILDDNENTEQPEQWIPFHLTMEQKESGQTQYLNMSELLAKLKLLQKNTEVNVIIHKEKKA